MEPLLGSIRTRLLSVSRRAQSSAPTYSRSFTPSTLLAAVPSGENVGGSPPNSVELPPEGAFTSTTRHSEPANPSLHLSLPRCPRRSPRWLTFAPAVARYPSYQTNSQSIKPRRDEQGLRHRELAERRRQPSRSA